MNLNGYSVLKAIRYYKIRINEILIIQDELDLIPGKFKLNFGVNYTSHNGIKNIVSCLNFKTDFYRLRIGVGRPKTRHSINKFVLECPNFEEMFLIEQTIIKSTDYILDFFKLH